MKNLFKFVVACIFFFASQQSLAQCVHGSLISVRATKIGIYNYVTFTFKGHHVPSFTIQNATPPFTGSSSGEPVSVAGCKFKNIRFGGGTQCHTSRYLLNLPFNSVKAVKVLEQFEGHYEYVIGYRCGGAFIKKYSIKNGPNWKMVLKFR